VDFVSRLQHVFSLALKTAVVFPISSLTNWVRNMFAQVAHRRDAWFSLLGVQTEKLRGRIWWKIDKGDHYLPVGWTSGICCGEVPTPPLPFDVGAYCTPVPCTYFQGWLRTWPRWSFANPLWFNMLEHDY